MKKIIYLLIAFGFTFMSCDPLEDINAEIDALPSAKDGIIGNLEYTFSKEDYTTKTKDGGYFEFKYPNFNTLDDAKTLIPTYLTGEYPFLGVTYKDDGEIKEASSAIMTFNWYNKIKTNKAKVKELTADEHNEITGQTYGTFSKSNQVFKYIAAKYPSPAEGDFISLRYDFYSGGTTTLTDCFFFNGTDWKKTEGFTPDQYKAMGKSYPNFSNHDEAKIKVPVTLLERYKFETKKDGDIATASYELYEKVGEDANGKPIKKTFTYTSNFIFNGAKWFKYNNVTTETIKFGHDGTTWVPDNTIKYTLAAADYDLVGNGKYGNFDVREGKDDETPKARLAKINTILLNNFPNAEEEQKFSVSYNVYSGSDEVWVMNVVLTAGAYVLQ